MNCSRPSYNAPDESILVDELTSAIIEDDNFPTGSQPIQVKLTGQLERSKSSISISSDSSFFPASQSTGSTSSSKRVAFLYDSTLTAFLMMGNLSPGLKNHAVTVILEFTFLMGLFKPKMSSLFGFCVFMAIL